MKECNTTSTQERMQQHKNAAVGQGGQQSAAHVVLKKECMAQVYSGGCGLVQPYQSCCAVMTLARCTVHARKSLPTLELACPRARMPLSSPAPDLACPSSAHAYNLARLAVEVRQRREAQRACGCM
eukprot:31327-Chlamydomonas_euryale.AAC.1